MTECTAFLVSFFRIQTTFLKQCCVLFLISHVALAQTQEVISNNTDISEEMRLFIAESDATDSIETLIQETFYTEKNIDLALSYSDIYLARGKKEENTDIQLFSNFQIAYISYFIPDYNETLKRAYITARIAERERDTAYAIRSNVLLGSTWYVQGFYEEALKPYLIAKDLAVETHNVSDEILCMTNIANIRAKLNRYGNALDSFDYNLTLLNTKEESLSTQDSLALLSSLLGKVLCLAELKRFDEAEATYAKGIAIAEKNGYQIFEGRFKINLGKVYYEQGKYFQSLGFLQEGREMLKEAGLQNNLYITDFYIAKNLVKQGKLDEALALLDRVFERAGEDTYTDRIEEMYDLAGDISKMQKNTKKEAFYVRKSRNIIKVKKEQQSAAKDVLHEADMNEFRLKNKKLANEKIQTLLDKKVITIVSIILVALLLLAFFAYYRKAKMNEKKFLTLIENISQKPVPEKTAVQNSSIKDEKAKAILAELARLESTNFYLSEEATLHSTAKLLNTNTTYLSKALNAVQKQTFSQYLNKLRIEYVLIKLKEDAVFRSYTIHAISKEIGYKSATTFIKEFKNKTGLTPSYYIRKIER